MRIHFKRQLFQVKSLKQLCARKKCFLCTLFSGAMSLISLFYLVHWNIICLNLDIEMHLKLLVSLIHPIQTNHNNDIIEYSHLAPRLDRGRLKQSSTPTHDSRKCTYPIGFNRKRERRKYGDSNFEAHDRNLVDIRKSQVQQARNFIFLNSGKTWFSLETSSGINQVCHHICCSKK